MPTFPFVWGFNPRGSMRGSASGTLTQLSASVTPVWVPYNPDRVGLFFYNNTLNNAFVLLASASASPGVFTNKIAPANSWAVQNPVYAGYFSVVFDGGPGTGSLQITEMSSPEN